MSPEQEFEQAAEKINTLKERPSNEDLLTLYALYKQATSGDIKGERPAGFNFKAIAKYDAWSALQGKSRESCMKEYIALSDRLA